MLEILSSDLHARLTSFELHGKTVLTPTLVPVVDPRDNILSPSEINSLFGFNFLITSSYLYLKRYGMPSSSSPSIHSTLDFDGLVMMDSGAYQILAYGDVDISPLQSLSLQSFVRPDIGVILDVPTPPSDSVAVARRKMEQTIERLSLSLDHIRSHPETIWTLPIQGGKNVFLIDEYIQRVKDLGLLDFFRFYALGSVVPLMSSYDYSSLFSMLYHARLNLPYHIPLHVFGAGHPMIFPFIVALGADTFDSAAYVLFAKEGRYMTPTGTLLLDNLQEFPCSCAICSSLTPKEVRQSSPSERMRALASHNLHVSVSEIKLIREAIRSGTLWELLEQRSFSHPRLYEAFRLLVDFSQKGFFDIGTPSTKSGGLKIYSSLSFFRPEFKISKERIFRNYQREKDQLFIYLLTGQKTPIELFTLDPLLKSKLINQLQEADIALLLPFFGLVPFELHETYPFSQFVFSNVIDSLMIEQVTSSAVEYIEAKGYKTVSIFSTQEDAHLSLLRAKLLEKIEKVGNIQIALDK